MDNQEYIIEIPSEAWNRDVIEYYSRYINVSGADIQIAMRRFGAEFQPKYTDCRYRRVIFPSSEDYLAYKLSI